MRKKIPTITRPDLAYAAALRPSVEEDPGREEGQGAEAFPETVSVTDLVAEEGLARGHVTTSLSPLRQTPETAAGIVSPPMAKAPRSRHIPTTRKIDIRVNALERQEEALIDCGVDPAHVIRAALRRGVKNWVLRSVFIPQSEERPTRITEWQARTSLAVDAVALTALLRAHDPLDVLSKWTLIRGQVEPRVWAEIDLILFELVKGAYPKNHAEGAPADHWPAQGANDTVE